MKVIKIKNSYVSKVVAVDNGVMSIIILNYQLKMLFFCILVINTLHICKGKAFLEETENDRGKRSYGYLPNVGLHQTYDPQSNAEHWMKGKYYQPQVGGQPIYVPAVDQSGSYNEFLDAYYKAYTPAWNPETPVQYKYESKSTSNEKDSSEYELPILKEKISVKMSTSDSDVLELEDYDDPEVVDTVSVTQFTNENFENLDEVSESLTKPHMPKTKPKEDKYNQPVRKIKQKQKTNAKSVLKTSTPKSIYKSTETIKVASGKENVKYGSSVPKESIFSDTSNTADDFEEYEEYDDSEVVDEFNEKSGMASESEENILEESVLSESGKSELTKIKSVNSGYDKPVVKQKIKIDKSQKFTTPKNAYKTTKKTVVKENVKYEPLSKKTQVLFEMSESGVGTDETVTEFNENSDKISEVTEQDEFEDPVVRESLKSEANEPNNQYDMPVVKTKQKQKVTSANDWANKPSPPKNIYKITKKAEVKDSGKYSVQYESVLPKKEFSVEMSKPNHSDIDSEDYDSPEIIETKTEFENENQELEAKDLEESVLSSSEFSKTKPQDNEYNMPVVIKPKKKSTPKKQIPKPQSENSYAKQTPKPIKSKPVEKTPIYGVKTSQGTRKVSKGKRRKQYSKPNLRTGDMDEEIISDGEIELSKKDGKPYPPKNYQTKAEENTTKEKVVVKQNPEYESVTKKSVVKRKNKQKKTSKPISTKVMVAVKSDNKYQPTETKKETVKQDSNYKPEKDIKYNSAETVQLKKLDEVKDLSENESTNTGNLTQNKPTLGSSDVSDSEISDQLNIQSTSATNENLGNPNKIVMKPEFTDSNANDFRGLSSMNSNIWSMLFNPNAEQNRLKLKRCITRSNETGFCTYIQNCEVPHIATSLEQLLNNACVIDDIFIGVCCPEFPVQTVKVQWDQTQPDFDSHIEDEFGHIAEDCGIRSDEASKLQSWPWKAPLVSMSNGKIFCGGVIVSEDHILTAAHCTTKIPKNQILVRLGQYDDESGDDYAVIEIKRHAQYNPRTMQNDVALLKLGRRIMNGAHIGIACIPDEEQDNDHIGEVATLLGWRGIFGTKSRDPEFLRVISNKECENKLGMKVPSTSLCTETRRESGRTCNADSGAPLVIEDDGRYEVIGILSWNRNDCDQRFPATFSRVSSYTGWIKNHIG